MQAILGIAVLTALAWALSENRRVVHPRLVIGGLVTQFLIAALLLKVPFSQSIFIGINDVVHALQQATQAGTSFVFGYLGGGDAPFETGTVGSTFILAFQALPLVLVISALSALLYYWRVLPAIVGGFAWALRRSFGVGGAVAVGVGANIFVGMVEAPLLIRPYLAKIGRGELFIVMVSGMATISGTVLVLYATILQDIVPGAAGHLVTASLISAPAAIMIAALMVPGAARPSADTSNIVPSDADSAMDAITRGTADGMRLLLNIIGMLIVLVALVSLLDQIIGLFPEMGGRPLSLARISGWVLSPVAWLMGVPWEEAGTAGSLLGTKVILNELLAYADMAALPQGSLSAPSQLIMTYALCGFANFGSLGIMIGGLATMAPERRGDVIALGLKSIVAGMIATCMTGAVAGLVTGI